MFKQIIAHAGILGALLYASPAVASATLFPITITDAFSSPINITVKLHDGISIENKSSGGIVCVINRDILDNLTTQKSYIIDSRMKVLFQVIKSDGTVANINCSGRVINVTTLK
jgi:hypothetical protein